MEEENGRLHSGVLLLAVDGREPEHVVVGMLCCGVIEEADSSMVPADREAERLQLPWLRHSEVLTVGGRAAEVGSRWWSCRRRGMAGCSVDRKGRRGVAEVLGEARRSHNREREGEGAVAALRSSRRWARKRA